MVLFNHHRHVPYQHGYSGSSKRCVWCRKPCKNRRCCCAGLCNQVSTVGSRGAQGTTATSTPARGDCCRLDARSRHILSTSSQPSNLLAQNPEFCSEKYCSRLAVQSWTYSSRLAVVQHMRTQTSTARYSMWHSRFCSWLLSKTSRQPLIVY